MATIQSQVMADSAMIMPGIYPATKSTSTGVPPEMSEYTMSAPDGGISRPQGEDATLAAAQIGML